MKVLSTKVARTIVHRVVLGGVVGAGLLSLAGCVVEPAGPYYAEPPHPHGYYEPGPEGHGPEDRGPGPGGPRGEFYGR